MLVNGKLFVVSSLVVEAVVDIVNAVIVPGAIGIIVGDTFVDFSVAAGVAVDNVPAEAAFAVLFEVSSLFLTKNNAFNL